MPHIPNKPEIFGALASRSETVICYAELCRPRLEDAVEFIQKPLGKGTHIFHRCVNLGKIQDKFVIHQKPVAVGGHCSPSVCW